MSSADVGILGGRRNGAAAAGGGGGGDGAIDDRYGEPEPTCLYDVYESLSHPDYIITERVRSSLGNACTWGKADGSTALSPTLPAMPGLRVTGAGELPLPLSEYHAKALKSNSNTRVLDGDFHKVYSVDAKKVKIRNPAWNESIKSLVETVAYKLGVDPTCLSAKIDSLLMMEKGSYVRRSLGSNAGQDALGTLIVQLPSVFTGGTMSVYNGSEEGTETGEEPAADTFSLGAGDDASFSCYFVAHYKDCEFEFEKLKSGCRLLLRYSLHYSDRPTPTVSMLTNYMSSVKKSLAGLAPSDRMLLIPTAKTYTSAHLAKKGFNALRRKHRAQFEAIRAALTEEWKIVMVNAEFKVTQVTGYYGHLISSENDTSVVNIYDEEGRNITKEEAWLKDAVDFQVAAQEAGGGMMLTGDFEDHEDTWGPPTACSQTSSYYRERNTEKTTYRASFILAYDTRYSDSELKCLSGPGGVAEVAAKIVTTRDYNLLERLLKVVGAKEKSKFDVQTCRNLLQMLTRSTGKNARSDKRVSFANQVLSGLSSSVAPDKQLYEAIIAAGEKFGWSNLASSIPNILSGEYRMKGHQLSTFLLRSDFILELNKRSENGPSNCLDRSIRDLHSFGADVISEYSTPAIMMDSGSINTKIHTMLAEHGWEAMATVIRATLTFLHNKSDRNSRLSAILDRAILLETLHNHPCDFIDTCLVDFADDFGSVLRSTTRGVSTSALKGELQRIFVKAICFVVAHGQSLGHCRVGQWASQSEDVMDALLDAIRLQSTDLGFDPNVLLRDILNKCLVHNSSRPYGWMSYRREGTPTVPSSLHVRKVLQEYPTIVREIDKQGRITLHHATDSKEHILHKASYVTVMDVFEAHPKGVSVCDPVTGLYPFMLAGSSGSTDASFRLLLADPSLVNIGSNQSDGTENTERTGRKRKRRNA